MTYSWFRAVAAVGVVTTALVTPSASYANFFGLFRSPCCGGTATTTYRPVIVAPSACSTCVPQTVQYAPQVCYRSVTVATPVTTYRPVTTCGPCGGATTVLRPVTTYVQTVQRVPYTAYRPVCATGCAPAATTAYYAPPANYYAPTVPSYAPASGCSSCASQQAVAYAPTSSYTPPYASPTSYAQPIPSYSGAAQPYAGATQPPLQSSSTPAATFETPADTTNSGPTLAPAYPGSQPAAQRDAGQPATPKPSLNENDNGRQESQRPENYEADPPVQPIPEFKKTTPATGLFRAPTIRDPQDQTAQRPRNSYMVPAVHRRPAPATQEELDAVGWRSVRN